MVRRWEEDGEEIVERGERLGRRVGDGVEERSEGGVPELRGECGDELGVEEEGSASYRCGGR